MRYYVTLDAGSPPLEIDVTELPSGALEVRAQGKPLDVDVLSIGRTLSVRVGGKVVDLTSEGAPPDLGVVASGQRSYVRVESERMRAAASAKKIDGASDRVVRSPMPGRVVKVHVSVGDEVERGHPLLVVEAMKMENEIRAKAPGRVAEVHVATGQTVEGNAKLVSFV